jgi:hypothetical protein
MISDAQIKIDIKGMDMEDVRKMEKMIHILFKEGVFHLQNGKAILNFDHTGELREISFDYKKWKKEKKVA